MNRVPCNRAVNGSLGASLVEADWKVRLFGFSSIVEIPCNGAVKGYLGASLVVADWQVRVFGFSGIVVRPSERLYVRTIPLYGFMDRRS